MTIKPGILFMNTELIDMSNIAGYMELIPACKPEKKPIKQPEHLNSYLNTKVNNIEINLKSKYYFDMLVMTTQGMEIVSINCHCKQFD